MSNVDPIALFKLNLNAGTRVTELVPCQTHYVLIGVTDNKKYFCSDELAMWCFQPSEYFCLLVFGVKTVVWLNW